MGMRNLPDSRPHSSTPINFVVRTLIVRCTTSADCAEQVHYAKCTRPSLFLLRGCGTQTKARVVEATLTTRQSNVPKSVNMPLRMAMTMREPGDIFHLNCRT